MQFRLEITGLKIEFVGDDASQLPAFVRDVLLGGVAAAEAQAVTQAIAAQPAAAAALPEPSPTAGELPARPRRGRPRREPSAPAPAAPGKRGWSPERRAKFMASVHRRAAAKNGGGQNGARPSAPPPAVAKSRAAAQPTITEDDDDLPVAGKVWESGAHSPSGEARPRYAGVDSQPRNPNVVGGGARLRQPEERNTPASIAAD